MADSEKESKAMKPIDIQSLYNIISHLCIIVNYTSIDPKQQESMFPSNGRDWDNGEFSGLCGLCAAYVSWSCRTAAKSLEKKKEKTRRETRGETSAGTRRNQEIMMEQTDFF